jgi:hypothetical protein
MTTLMPQRPGHWTEAVLLAFPDAALTNDAPVPGVLHVTLPLADDLEIEFREDPFALPDALEVFSANLQEYDADHHLIAEEPLYEAPDVESLLEETQPWVERYRADMAALDALETVPEYWVREVGDK